MYNAKSTLLDLPFQRVLDSKDPLMWQQGYPRMTKIQLGGHLKTALENIVSN